MRGRVLIEESRELVVVLDEEDRVLVASRRAREALEGLEEGQQLPRALLEGEDVLEAPYEVDRRRERIVYLRSGGDAAAYQELRAGFTASVSHELRTPLARVLGGSGGGAGAPGPPGLARGGVGRRRARGGTRSGGVWGALFGSGGRG